MAKSKFRQENNIYPPGIILLTQPVSMPDGKKYQSIWAPWWDSILRDPKLLEDEKKITSKDWTWCAFDKNDICVFHITGDHILDYQAEENTTYLLDTYIIS